MSDIILCWYLIYLSAKNIYFPWSLLLQDKCWFEQRRNLVIWEVMLNTKYGNVVTILNYFIYWWTFGWREDSDEDVVVSYPGASAVLMVESLALFINRFDILMIIWVKGADQKGYGCLLSSNPYSDVIILWESHFSNFTLMLNTYFPTTVVLSQMAAISLMGKSPDLSKLPCLIHWW